MPVFTFEIVRHGEAPVIADILRLSDEQTIWCYADGPEDADFATTLDDDPPCLRRHPEETVAMFEERVCDELCVRGEHNRRKNPVRVIVFQSNSEVVH